MFFLRLKLFQNRATNAARVDTGDRHPACVYFALQPGERTRSLKETQ
jgi:hypothetical protein